MHHLKIGTRKSELALAQTRIVVDKIQLFYKNSVNIEIIPFSTTGDEIQTKPLYEIGGKAVFSKSIHQALINKTIDCAVHSLKDLEAIEPEGIKLACILEREDPRDVFISKNPIRELSDIPKGWVLGTSSPRREAQIKYFQPEIGTTLLRGNVQTRLKKLIEDPQIDGTVLAAAGLMRLGLIKNHYQRKLNNLYIRFNNIEETVPSVGQGAIAVDCRSDDHETIKILKNINCPQTNYNVTFERYFIECLNATCRTAVGVYVTQENNHNIMYYDYYHERKKEMIKEKTVINSKKDIQKTVKKMGVL